MTKDYRLSTPIDADDERTADAVIENEDGAWLAEWDHEAGEAMYLSDDSNDYLPAPDNWRDLIVVEQE